MFKRFASHQIPLYFAILLLLLIALGVTWAFYYLRQNAVANYKVYVPNGETSQEVEYGSWPALANKNFFNEVKDKFVAEKTDFIEADLSGMQLTVWQNGVATQKFPILTKGRPGSWWETPAGLYKIETREKNHFSSFAGVYLPWSLPFQGNFFIHGWPYYPNGTPVSSKYSGGCIRLSTEDAEKVFALAKVGTPVLVYEKDFDGDDFQYRMKTPVFDAKTYVAGDLKSNFVFAEQGANDLVPIASITKLMTALVAVEYVNIENEITITNSMIIPTSKPRLQAGQKISLFNLLPLLLEESSNEAAQAIASYLGPQRFVGLMNQKAQAIGMTHTHFTDASGRDDGNVSTAHDLFELAKYLYHNRSFILKTTRGEIDDRVYGPLAYTDVRSYNGFENDPDFLGGKVGLTNAAGQTILSLFNIKDGEETRPVAVVLLNTPDEFGEVQRVIDWIKGAYF